MTTYQIQYPPEVDRRPIQPRVMDPLTSWDRLIDQMQERASTDLTGRVPGDYDRDNDQLLREVLSFYESTGITHIEIGQGYAANAYSWVCHDETPTCRHPDLKVNIYRLESCSYPPPSGQSTCWSIVGTATHEVTVTRIASFTCPHRLEFDRGAYTSQVKCQDIEFYYLHQSVCERNGFRYARYLVTPRSRCVLPAYRPLEEMYCDAVRLCVEENGNLIDEVNRLNVTAGRAVASAARDQANRNAGVGLGNFTVPPPVVNRVAGSGDVPDEPPPPYPANEYSGQLRLPFRYATIEPGSRADVDRCRRLATAIGVFERPEAEVTSVPLNTRFRFDRASGPPSCVDMPTDDEGSSPEQRRAMSCVDGTIHRERVDTEDGIFVRNSAYSRRHDDATQLYRQARERGRPCSRR